MSFNEATVRESIAANLNMIELGLELVDQEYHLRNEFGTYGFVDILATDNQGKLVIIEVKISKSTEREAITELVKYVGLVKQKMNLRDSDFRLFVISTDWRELLVPLSEFDGHANYNVTGYEAETNEEGDLLNINKKDLLTEIISRKFVRHHLIYHFTDKNRRDSSVAILTEKLEELGISNYVLALFSYEVTGVGEEFAIYFAQQLESEEFFLSILERLFPDSVDDYKEELQDYEGEELICKYSEYALCHIEFQNDGLSVSYPEKIDGYMGQGSWEIESIKKFGAFQRDIRLSDEQILHELRGLDGAQFNSYTAVARTNDNSKFAEILHNYSSCLEHNDKWKHSIRDFLEYVRSKDTPGLISVKIFNPDDVLISLYKYVSTDSTSYLPAFLIAVENDDGSKIELLAGQLAKNNIPGCTYESMLASFFSSDPSNILFRSSIGSMFEINEALVTQLGLVFSVDYFKYVNAELAEHIADPRIVDNKVEERVGSVSFDDIDTWMTENSELIEKLQDYLSKHTIGL